MSSLGKRNKSYYDEIEEDRYRCQGHINQILDWITRKGKGVLEIGTDVRNIIGSGPCTMVSTLTKAPSM